MVTRGHQRIARILSSVLLLSIVATVHAQDPTMTGATLNVTDVFTDVPAGIWYEGAVRNFLQSGYLDRTHTRFRPYDLATRAEVVKLLVEPNNGITKGAKPTAFDDTRRSGWFAAYFDEAAARHWVLGDGACAGKHPCKVRPDDRINRAEIAALLARVYALPRSKSAPLFADNEQAMWYQNYLQIMADHCIFSDTGEVNVHASLYLTRAEVVDILFRALRNPHYGLDCSKPVSSSRSSNVK